MRVASRDEFGGTAGTTGQQAQFGDGLGGLGDFALGLCDQLFCFGQINGVGYGVLGNILGIRHGDLLVGKCRLSTDDAPHLRRRMVTGVDELVEFGEGGVQRLHPIGQTLGDGLVAKEQACFGRTHGADVQTTHGRDVVGEEGVEPIDLALQLGPGGIRQRFVRGIVVLVGTSRDRGEAVAVLGILDRLVHMQGNHANRTDTAGFCDEQALCACR